VAKIGDKILTKGNLVIKPEVNIEVIEVKFNDKFNDTCSIEQIDEIPTNLIVGKLYKLIACNDDKELELKFFAERCKDINNPTLPTKFFEPNGKPWMAHHGLGYTINGVCIVSLIKVKTVKNVSFGVIHQISFEFDANGSPIIHPPEFKLLETNNINCCVFDYKGLLLSCSETDFNKCFIPV